MRILVVEDENGVAEHIQRQLAKSGYTADISSDGCEACALGETQDYSAVILDLGLPRLDGLSILRRWRQNGRSMPVIVVTARGAWTERVSGIDAGADDYLIKPFVIEELLARLRAVLRRTAETSATALVAGGFDIDLRRRQVLLDGASIALTPLEYRLLVYLCRRPDTIVAPKAILEHLHGTSGMKDVNSLERLIARLRKKIGPERIETRRGYGYLLTTEK